MTLRTICLGLSGALMALQACAADGLQPPTPDAFWPQWQVRIGLQTGHAAPLSLTAPFGPTRLGLGQASAAWQSGLALTADLGLVAERSTGAPLAVRAVLGGEGSDTGLHDARLAPLLKLGVRYSF